MNKKKDAAAPVGDPIAVLRKEHVDSLDQLAKLENASDSIRFSGFSAEAFHSVAEAIRYIELEFRKHDEKEEQHLFPIIEKHRPGETRIYVEEHRELWRAFRELKTLVQNVEDGRIHGSSIIDLIQTAQFIVDHLRTHIEREEEVLFPLVKQLFTNEDYKRLTKAVAAMQAST